jgi:glycosyltransferase involved in cell wall biosynthesis
VPAVSIITALHEKGSYVAETAASVRAQTVADWEMIVVDNGSTDDGPEQVRRLVSQDGRIRLVSSLKRGPGAARNFGLGQAKGDWVLFLDADDLIESSFVAEQLAAVRAHPEAHIVAGSWQEFEDPTPAKRSIRRPAGWGQSSTVVSQTAIASAPWALHAAIVRRDWIGRHRRWQEALDDTPTEDTAFWFGIVLDAVIAWSDCRGALYRVNTANSRNAFLDGGRWFQAIGRVVETNVRTLQDCGQMPSPAQCENIMRLFEEHYRRALRNGNGAVASLAQEQARLWLRKCRTLSVAVGLRKLVGIGLTARLAGLRLPR